MEPAGLAPRRHPCYAATAFGTAAAASLLLWLAPSAWLLAPLNRLPPRVSYVPGWHRSLYNVRLDAVSTAFTCAALVGLFALAAGCRGKTDWWFVWVSLAAAAIFWVVVPRILY